jgi:acyl-ACP thioesterase
MDGVFQAHYQVRSYEVDGQGRLRPVTLLNYLQDAAGLHALKLGVAVSQLLERRLTWVLSRYHVRFDSYPGTGARLEVRTWPSARQGLFALRDFEVIDDSGRTVITATSSWVLLSLSSRRPVRLAEHLPNYPTVERRAVLDDFATLPVAARTDLELPFRVRFGDLDFNRHVNNTVFADWALETVPPEIIRDWRPASVEIGYRAEALYGDRIIVRTQIQELGESAVFLHQLINDRDGRELTRLRTAWTPAGPQEEGV